MFKSVNARTNRYNPTTAHPIQRSSRWLTVNAAFLLACSLALLATFISADYASAWWHIATIGSAWFMYKIGRVAADRFYHSISALIITLAATLSITTCLVGLDIPGLSSSFTGPEGRVTLFFDNPNLLAASLCMFCLSGCLLRPRWAYLLIPLSVAAIIFTGSRLALIALVSSFLISAVFNKRLTLRSIIIGFASIALISGFSWLQQSTAVKTNLLMDANSFQEKPWRVHPSSSLRVAPDATAGPFEGSLADKLEGSSTSDVRLVVFQNIPAPDAGTPLTASIYLRADQPQTVKLSTRLSRTNCDVTIVWQRCVTPVGMADGELTAQLALQTAGESTGFSVYAWGAQLEKATAATPFVSHNKPLLSFTALYRQNPEGTSFLSFKARTIAFKEAFKQFAAHPIAGVGQGNFEDARVVLDGYTIKVNHAHNLFLGLLAETGVLGLLSWGLCFFSILIWDARRHWQLIMPLCVGILILNIADYSYFSAGVYYVYWLTLGLLIAFKGASSGAAYLPKVGEAYVPFVDQPVVSK